MRMDSMKLHKRTSGDITHAHTSLQEDVETYFRNSAFTVISTMVPADSLSDGSPLDTVHECPPVTLRCPYEWVQITEMR
ncbi:hypothetical protein Q5P01_000818 [Channa striata]|uniref:Uncharacterized protein n=1 Tax=Channa striata TaxID=64152 RepID=A0AA88IYM9_CHASR|nr:hypothetical protein Q5P01_000818 [Channa striata]